MARLSIQHRLTLITMLPTVVILLLGSLAFYQREKNNSLTALADQLLVLAEMVGANSAGALAFDDANQAGLSLASLKADLAVQQAVILKADGRVFARFGQIDPIAGARWAIPVADPAGRRTAGATVQINLEEQVVSAVRPILLDGQRIGSIGVRSDLRPVTERLDVLLRLTGVGVVGLLLVSFALSKVLQKAVSQPILELTRVAQKVALDREYSRRAQRFGDDELGDLTDRVNDMLHTMELNTSKLEAIARDQKLESERKSVQHREVAGLVSGHAEVISRVGQGDFTARFREGGSDELSTLSRHLNGMVERIAVLIAQVQSTVASLGATTAEVESTLATQTESFLRHSEVSNLTGRSVEQLRQAASLMAQQATEVARETQQSTQRFRLAGGSLDQTLQSMQRITSSSETASLQMDKLIEQVDRVEDILSTVTDVAEQSKLLSLNAAIEAARAGLSGKGFSVVAIEVRNLALQSAEATQQIKGILRGIREASESVSTTFQRSRIEVQVGMEHIGELHAIHDQVKSSLEQSGALAHNAEGVSSDQLRKTDDIGAAIRDSIDRMDKNLQSSQSILQTMNRLTELARALAATVERFRSRSE